MLVLPCTGLVLLVIGFFIMNRIASIDVLVGHRLRLPA